MLEQRQLLTELAAGKSLTEACEMLDIPRGRVQRWLVKDEKFREHFDELFSPENLKELQKILNLAAARAVEVYEDAINEANRQVKIVVNCQKCGAEVRTEVTVEDWRSRLHAADTLLKVSGILREHRDVKVQIDVGPIDWSRLEVSDLVNILAWKTGRPLAPQVKERLRVLGVLTAEDEGRKLLPLAIEGEFTEMQPQL